MKAPITMLVVFQSLAVIPSFGQNFVYHSNAPFGIQVMHEDSSHVANKIMFFDFDGDDDLDLFLSGVNGFGDFESWESIEYFIEMQENTGDKWNPQFADRVEPFADFPFPIGYFFPAIGDVNNDGNPDFVVFGDVNAFGGRTILYLENDGRSSAGFNVVRGEVFELTDFVPESFFVPELVDLDADGDLDVLMSGFDPAFAEENGADVPTFYYAQNRDVRSPSSAADFKGWYWNPYGLTPSPLSETLTSGDIDNDGDVDLLGTTLIIPVDSINRMYVHVNTPGITGKPIFDVVLEAPFGLPTSFGEEQLLFPDLVDLDSDGDLDLIVFKVTAQGNVLEYYENTLCQPVIEEVSLTICDGDVALIGDEIFTEPGEYVISLKASNGCDSTVILLLEVEEVDVNVEINENVLTANEAGGTYQWFDCDSGANIPGATNQTYVVLATGNYAVNITDASGCLAISGCVHIIITGTAEVALSKGITMYPNPTSGLTSILNDTPFPVSSMTLINIAGQHIGEYKVSGTTPIDISWLESGVYFVKIVLNDKEIVKKIIIK